MKQKRVSLAEIIGERTLHITNPKKLAKEIAAFLLLEERTSDLSSLMRDVMKYRMKHGIVEAVAVSAHELGDTVIEDIEDLLRIEFPKAKKFIVTERHEPELIGGVKIQMAHEQLDLSVKDRLNIFKRVTAQERNQT